MPRSLVTLSLAATLFLTACGDDSAGNGADKPAEGPAKVMIGAVYDLTGAQAQYDIQSAKGAELAVAQRNQSGGLLGGPVTLAIADGKSGALAVMQASADLAAAHPDTSALFGLSDTDLVLAAAPIAQDHGLLFVTSGATSPQLPEQVPEILWLACFGDNVQAAAGAEWAVRSLGARKAAVLFDMGHTYTALLHGYFAERFKELGGEIVASSGFDGPANAEAPIAALPEADLIYLAAETPAEAAALARALRDAGHTAPILGGDGFDDPQVWLENAGLADIYYTTHAYLGPGAGNAKARAFAEAYRKVNGRGPDPFAALGFDTANLVMHAVELAESADPAKVLAAMATIREFEGATGTFRYPPGARIPVKTVTVMKVANGETALAQQILPDKVPPP